jgi:hypothetical protein
MSIADIAKGSQRLRAALDRVHLVNYLGFNFGNRSHEKQRTLQACRDSGGTSDV